MTRSQLSYWRYWRGIISLLYESGSGKGERRGSLLLSPGFHLVSWMKKGYIYISLDPNNGMEKEYGRIGFYEFYRIFSTVTFVRDDFVQKNRRVLAYNFDSKYELSDYYYSRKSFNRASSSSTKLLEFLSALSVLRARGKGLKKAEE